MDFFTTSASPVAVTIDGKAYQVPRFLTPQLRVWQSMLATRQLDAAAAEITNEDQRARFKLYWSSPIIDVAYLLQLASTPDGAAYVVNAQLRLAGVPGETVDKLIDNADPLTIRSLAQELTFAPQTLTALDANDGAKPPLVPPPTASDDSRATTAANVPASEPSMSA